MKRLFKLRNGFTGKVIVSGRYESLKDLVEANKSSLRGANLDGANLDGCSLERASLRGASLNWASLRGASLRGVSLRGASLRGASLNRASLRGASLEGITGYANSHAIFAELVRRCPMKTFPSAQWSAIGQIVLHQLCWDSIRERFSEQVPGIFSALAQRGYGEWLEKWNQITKQG